MAEELASYERRFRRAGLPLFIQDYKASEDVFNRAAPLLALVFLIEMLGAIDLDWSVWANLAAAFGGLVILLAAFGGINVLRGRPFWCVPDSVGWPELAAFVLLPAALPVIFGGQVTSAIVTALGNVLLLALVLGVVGFGLISIVRWAAARLLGQLAASLSLLARAVPLLLLFALVLFINTEMWQVFSTMPDAFLITAALVFAALGTSFLIFRLPRELGELERDAVTGPPLATHERVNVGLVMLVSQALQVLVVSLAVGGFFVAFGALAVGPDVRDSWIGSDGNVLIDLAFFGERAQITVELLRVSGGIAAFSGLYYAIAVLTDSTYREEFLDELSDEMRSTFRARSEYITRLEPGEAG